MPSDPLRDLQSAADAEYVPFGSADGEPTPVVATFGHYEAEYAAIRKGVGILHEPQLGVLNLAGADVRDFVHRLCTQDINKMTGGQSWRAFQLNLQGRITTDMVVHHGDESTWLEADRCDLPALAELYDSRLFTEDVKIEDWSPRKVALALHGPATGDLLRQVADTPVDAALDMPQTHHVVKLAGHPVTVSRRDDCGEVGLRIWVERDGAPDLYEKLTDAVGGLVPDVDADAESGGAKRDLRGRGIGWFAYNTARIEAGRPRYHVDFGPDTLPAETGDLFDEAVSLTKGCYLGQEIVARMHALGHPKKVLVGIRFDDDRLPVAGAPVYEQTDDDATAAPTAPRNNVIGGVTSSTHAPMLSQQAVAFAMMRWGKHCLDTRVAVPADGGFTEGVVQSLRFLP